MKKVLASLADSWGRFWFSPVSLLNLAAFRIVLLSTFFFLYLNRQFDLQLFYSENGMLPKKLALAVIPEFYRAPFLLALWPDEMLSWVHGLYVGLLLLWALGLSFRPLAILTWLLHIAFLQRNYSVAFGADLIGGIFMFYLAFTQSCARLSLRSIVFKNLRLLPKVESDIFTSMFYRIIQIQLCVIYGYTGFEKLKGSTWWDGTALWNIFANSQMVIADFSWMKHFPIAIAVLSFSSVLFEIYFPVLVWFKGTRRSILIFGFAFHLGIGMLMALHSFSLVMLAPYLLFLNEDQVRNVLRLKKISGLFLN